MTEQYIELRARSAFSFLEGAAPPEDLVDRAAALGYPAIALGDRDGLYGAPRFYHAAARAGIKAIVGAELTLADESRLYLLVPDRQRYQNLCRMITTAKLRPLEPDESHSKRARSRISSRPLEADDPSLDPLFGAPKYPPKDCARVTLDDLDRFGAGMICLAGGSRSPLSRMLTRGEDPAPMLDRLAAIFGRGNLFIDIQRHLDPDEERLNRKLIALASHSRTPIVATNDVCFSPLSSDERASREKFDRALLDVLTCIRLKTTLEAAGRALWANAERYLKPAAAMTALFRDLPGAIAATSQIADRCEFTLKDLGYRFPDYPLPPGETPDSYLRVLTYAGARDRWGARLDDRTRNQLEHELQMVARLKLAGYFLIVWDIVQFCRENRIMAQGRGSAANSAVCYALGITAVDAVRMELLFERFLSEERGEWPDIDLDLPSGDQRERVIQYLYRRYGDRGAAMTANVITYRTRSAVREIARVLSFPPDQIDRLARLARAYEFRDDRDDYAALLKQGGVDASAPRIRMLVELTRRIQNLPRHLGQHSGGMVIAAGPIDEIVPLEPASMPGRVVIQWDKEDCADLGIIKIDLLGLGMLAVLEQALPLIEQHQGVAIDLAHIPADDPQVYAMLQRADTIGVFQVESRAQMATLPRMKPRCFYDLVVEVAIIRPGPIVGKMVHPYLDNRAGRTPIRYAHPALEPILKRTLGVPLFQEQILRMAMAVAGFSGGEAEELRRAMGFKRSAARMRDIEQRLRMGMARKGITGRTADEIVNSISSFALYGFPESHAASFALIAYASAYLKCHHPAAFFAAMLNCYPLGFYHPSTLVKDAERHGVGLLPIDVTQSMWQCGIEHGALRLGLKYIDGLREDFGNRIVAARAAAQFRSIADFAARTAPSRRDLDSLAHAGAFGAFGLTRRDALWQVAAVERDPGSLLAGLEPAAGAPALAPMTTVEHTLADYASTGVTAGPHLMAHLRSRLRKSNVMSAAELAAARDGQIVRTAGVVIVRQRPGTAKGFFFLTLEDETGIANAIVTPALFHEHRALLSTAAVLWIEGELQQQDGVSSIRARRFARLNLRAPFPARTIFIDHPIARKLPK
ncbi:MAG: error-prone DNA polymerase [Candidatus Binataceae bacterium]|nr:error-prone DNA polymerase [Candidatus Binataceae bacterium]